jgi:ABC-type multidrug transport system fused ATPase/permease subunit
MKTRRRSALALVVLVIAVLAFCLLPPIPVMAVSSVDFYSANDPEIMIVTLARAEMLLLTVRMAVGGIVASMIIIAIIMKNKIEKVVSSVRQRLIFGHHPGPPFFIVLFSSLGRALKDINGNLAEFFTGIDFVNNNSYSYDHDSCSIETNCIN